MTDTDRDVGSAALGIDVQASASMPRNENPKLSGNTPTTVHVIPPIDRMASPGARSTKYLRHNESLTTITGLPRRTSSLVMSRPEAGRTRNTSKNASVT
jgi:hypothetical protein